MTRRLVVGLLFGGMSPEHEVSIVSARSIAAHIDQERFEVRPIGIARNGVWTLLGDPFARLAAGEQPAWGECPYLPLEAGAEHEALPDVFFNIIHGAQGEDGQLQGHLDLLDRPHTGAGILAMAAGMDKWITKLIWASAGLPVAPYRAFAEERWRREGSAVLLECREMELPLFVKPANAGSSIGITKVKAWEGLIAAIEEALRYDRRVIVEQGLDAREVEVAVLGGEDPIVSVPGEILVAGEFYDFNDKYIDGKSHGVIPAEIPEAQREELRQVARDAYRVMDAYGMARVDFFLERATGRVYLNEINLLPGFTSISMWPKLMEASGVPYAEQITRLIDLALLRHGQMRMKQKGFKSGSDWFVG